MQAALEDAAAYSSQREVFGRPLAAYQLTRMKLARMAFLLVGCRQLTAKAARLLAKGDGQLEASMVKQLACRMAEWVTREAQQLHGGMGYAEEFAVSRYFLDARVLPIFEGADEVLALRVIARQLLARALSRAERPARAVAARRRLRSGQGVCTLRLPRTAPSGCCFVWTFR